MSHSFNLMTPKHGDFFKSVESTPSDAASPLSVFLTGCKGNLCPEVFGLVVQFRTQVTNSRTEDNGGFEAAVPVGQAGCLPTDLRTGWAASPRGIYRLETGKHSSTCCKGEFTAVNPRTARIFSFFCTRVSCVCPTSPRHEPYYYLLQPVHGELLSSPT